jgi:N-acetylglucosamine malate deacetylase 1
MRQPIKPELFVNTASVHETKLAALAEHKSQGEWLDVSQGMDSYLDSMNEMSQLLGRMSGQFQHAEGWRRHSHLGFCAETADPLREALGAQALVPRPRNRFAPIAP